MLQRTLSALVLGVLVSTAAASAQAPEELMLHRRNVAGTRMVQRAAFLPVPPPPPNAAARPQLANVPPDSLPVAVAVESYLLQHGHLVMNGPYMVDAERTDSGGWVIHVSTPAGNFEIWVHAPGPFFPVPTDNIPRVVISTLVVDINNGY